MARVKRGVAAHKRHKRLLKSAEGKRGTHRRLIRSAREAQLHAMAYAYRGRKERKRQMRSLWITRINAAARLNGLTYGTLIHGLKTAGVELDRRSLADIGVRDAATFARIAEVAKSA
jgi:large subunit ribosomal protein L20